MRPDSRLARTVQKVAGSDAFAKVAPKVVPPLDRAVHKFTGGRVLLAQAMLPSVMLTSTGARSGKPRRTPLATVVDGDAWYLVGSNFGGDAHPAWSYNLLAHPEATIDWHGEEVPVRAELLTSEEKAEVWPELTAVWPPFDRYVERSGRDLRVFRLRRH